MNPPVSIATARRATRVTWAALALSATCAFALGCRAPTRAATLPPSAQDAPGALVYHLRALDQRGMRVRVVIPQARVDALDDTLLVHLPLDHQQRSPVRRFRATTAGGQDLRVSALAPDRLLVHLEAREALHLAYDVEPTFSALDATTRFEAFVTDGYFFVPGHSALIQFPHLWPGPQADVITLSMEPGGGMLCSVEPGRTALRRALDAACVGGRLVRLQQELDATQRVVVHAPPHLRTHAEALLPVIARVLRAQSKELRSVPDRVVHVTLLARSDRAPPTGSGRSGGFVLELHPDDPLDGASWIDLIAHENLHRLIGHWITFSDVEPWRTAWFLEGITEYLAQRALLRAGLTDTHRFLEHVALSADLVSEAHRERSNPRIPYDQGFLAGVALDANAPGVLDALIERLATAGPSEPVSEALLLDLLRELLGDASFERYLAWCCMADVPPLAELWTALDLEPIYHLNPQPRFGVHLAEDERGWSVGRVEAHSAAERQGLRTGQRLAAAPTRTSTRQGERLDIIITDERGQRSVALFATAGAGERLSLRPRNPDPLRRALGAGPSAELAP